MLFSILLSATAMILPEVLHFDPSARSYKAESSCLQHLLLNLMWLRMIGLLLQLKKLCSQYR